LFALFLGLPLGLLRDLRRFEPSILGGARTLALFLLQTASSVGVFLRSEALLFNRRLLLVEGRARATL
jgi:hypothetical protein